MTVDTDSLAGHFSPHLKELRTRLLIVVLAVVVCSGLSYLFAEELVRLFIAPLRRAQPDLERLIYTSLTEAFVSYLKMAVLVGVILSFPVWCYETWMFVAPGLRNTERRLFFRILFWSTALFAGGVVFCYWAVIPRALSFLLGLAGEGIRPLPKLGDYLTFVVRSCLAFGLAFEIPFLMVAAGLAGLVEREYFVRQRKYFYLAILALAFLLTAGDLFAAVLLAVPLFGLYEAGLLVMRVFAAGQAMDAV